MTRRGLLGAFCGLVPVAAVQRPGVVGTRYEQPYTDACAYCPQCGRVMEQPERRSSWPVHDSARLWICRWDRTAWRIPVQRLEATRVEYVEPGT